MSDDCLFCKIAAGSIPATIIHRDDDVVAFEDINPQAPHHVIIIPQEHIATINDLEPANGALIGKLVETAKAIAAERSFAGEGYRLVMNCNTAGGQTVFHIHMHLLGGRSLSWPPG
jgi:histidine triad (HIT) family protein